MGFRSTFVSEHYGHTLPTWFTEKHKDYMDNPDGTLIVSKLEVKMYWSGSDLFIDYQKALIEIGLLKNDFTVHAVVMGEDGIITKINITAGTIKYYLYIENENDEIDGIWSGQF